MGTDHASWSEVDGWFTERLVAADPGLDGALRAASEAGLPEIAVSAPQGKFLHLLARLSGARRVLEVGTLGGYSTIWLARALPPDGEVVTLELDPHHAAVARESLAGAGVADRVQVVVGAARDTLPTLDGPFDLVFVDADKANNAHYVTAALALSRPGTVIVVDNVVRGGATVDLDDHSTAAVGSREVTELIADDPRLDATVLQTVGVKGYDGFLLAEVSRAAAGAPGQASG